MRNAIPILQKYEPLLTTSAGSCINLLEHLGLELLQQGYVLAKLTYTAMGHLIVDPLIYDYEYRIGKYTHKAIFPVSSARSANYEFSLQFECRSFCFYDSPIIDYLLSKLPKLPPSILDLSGEIHTFTSGPYRLYPALSSYKPEDDIFSLQSRPLYIQSRSQFNKFLEERNLRPREYICLHMRSHGFKSDSLHQSEYILRNTPISDLTLAIDFLYDHQIKVVRVGGVHMPPLYHHNVVDLAVEPLSFPFADYLLTENSLFNLYDSSGAAFFSVLSRARTYLYNLAPPMMMGWGPDDMCIFQKLINIDSGSVVSLSDIYKPYGPATTCSAVSWERMGYTSLRNTPVEILGLCMKALLLSNASKENYTRLISSIRKNTLSIRLNELVPSFSFGHGFSGMVDPSFLSGLSHKFFL